MLEDKEYLKHHGILGMKWGVRRTPEQLGYKTSTKMPKKIHTVTSDPNATKSSDGYYTTNKKNEHFQKFANSMKNTEGATMYDMTIKIKDAVIKPSQKEMVDIQVEMLKDKKIEALWAEGVSNQFMKSMYIAEKHQNIFDYERDLEWAKSPEGKASLGAKQPEVLKQIQKGYDEIKKEMTKDKQQYKKEIKEDRKNMSTEQNVYYFSVAVMGNKKLQEAYKQTLLDKGFNAVDDSYWGWQNYDGKIPTTPSAMMILDDSILGKVKIKPRKG